MRVLGIDYGDARVGLAISDALGITAQSLAAITHENNDKIILKKLEEVFASYEINTIAIGMPLNMSGQKTVRAEKTEAFIHKLKCKFSKVKIVEIDERLTTVAAHKTMNFLDVDKKKKRGMVDSIAAVYILEGYLNKSKKN